MTQNKSVSELAQEKYPEHLRGDIVAAFEDGFYACINFEKPEMQIKAEYDTTKERDWEN